MGFTAKGTPKTHYWMIYQYPMYVQCFPVVWDWSNLKTASRLYIQLIFHCSSSVEMYVFWRVMGCKVLPVNLKAVNVALCQVKEISVRENTFSFKVSPRLKWPAHSYCPNWINQGVMGSAITKGEFANPNLGIWYRTRIVCPSLQFSLSSLKQFWLNANSG